MLYDIFALQDRWGANDSHARGNTIYRGPRTDTVDTIWDAGGRDTLDASARSKAVTLDLRAGHFSQFGDHQDVSIAFGTSIESAVGGSGSDRLTGNSTANTLAGHAGSDWLKGLGGDDTIRAGGGNDAVDGGVGDDRLLGQGGRDRFLGGAGDDVMRGGAGADAFIFARGDDKDLIADFRNDFDGLEFDGYRSLDWVLGRATEADDDVVFRLGGGDRLTVSHVALNEITDDILLA